MHRLKYYTLSFLVCQGKNCDILEKIPFFTLKIQIRLTFIFQVLEWKYPKNIKEKRKDERKEIILWRPVWTGSTVLCAGRSTVSVYRADGTDRGCADHHLGKRYPADYQGFLGAPQRVHSVTSIYRGAVGVPNAVGPRLEEQSGALGDMVTDGLVGFLYEGLQDFLGENMTMTQEELKAVVDQSTVKDFIADKAAGLVSDYVMGEVTTTISGEEIKQLIEENQTLIEQVVGQPLPAEVIDQIAQVVETNEIVQKLETEGLAGVIDQMGGAIPEEGGNALGGLKPKDPNALGNQIFGEEMGGTIAGITNNLTGGKLEGLGSISDVLTLLRSVTSVGKLILGIGICLVLMAAIILVNIKQLGKGLRRSGYPLLYAGAPFFANLVVLFVPSLFTVMPLNVAGQILRMTAVVNGTVFGLGLALVIAGIVVGIIAKKKAAAQPVLAPVGAPAVEEVFEEAVAELAEEVAENCEATEETETEESDPPENE